MFTFFLLLLKSINSEVKTAIPNSCGSTLWSKSSGRVPRMLQKLVWFHSERDSADHELIVVRPLSIDCACHTCAVTSLSSLPLSISLSLSLSFTESPVQSTMKLPDSQSNMTQFCWRLFFILVRVFEFYHAETGKLYNMDPSFIFKKAFMLSAKRLDSVMLTLCEAYKSCWAKYMNFALGWSLKFAA